MSKTWRTCKGRYLVGREWHSFDNGLFHLWGSNYTEFESGPGNYTVAIVELEDGRVVTVSPEDLQFTGFLEISA